MRKAFASHDKDSSGTLDAAEAQVFFSYYVELNAEFQKRGGAAAIVANMDEDKLQRELNRLIPERKSNNKMVDASERALQKMHVINKMISDMQKEMDQLVAEYAKDKENRNRKAFAAIDKDKSGTLEVSELVAALAPAKGRMPGYGVQLALGLIPSVRQRAPDLAKYFDVLEDMAGLASDQSMLLCLLDPKKLQAAENRKDELREQAKEQMRMAFASHDKDGSGTLDAEEAQIFFSHYVELNAEFQKRGGAAAIFANMEWDQLLRGTSRIVPKDMNVGKPVDAAEHAIQKTNEIKEMILDMQNKMEQLIDKYYTNKAARDRHAFAAIDKDQNGTLEIEELVVALVPMKGRMPGYGVQLALGLIPTVQQRAPHLAKYFDILGELAGLALGEKMHDCLVDPKKMVDAENRKDELREQAKEQMRMAFASHDKDGSGTLDAEEAQIFFSHYAELNAEFQKRGGAAAIVANYDVAKFKETLIPSHVDLVEYKNNIKKDASDLSHRRTTEINKIILDMQNELDQLVDDYYADQGNRDRRAFVVLDKDKSGTLQVEELVAALVPGFYDDARKMPGYDVQLALGLIDKKTLEKAEKAAASSGCAQQ
jgi:Ca2+-binding EF-hand superfamily protein